MTVKEEEGKREEKGFNLMDSKGRKFSLAKEPTKIL